jgi:hypothetical protein
MPGRRLATDTLDGAAFDSGSSSPCARRRSRAWSTHGCAPAGLRVDPRLQTRRRLPRYAMRGSMATLGAHLAQGLDMRLNTCAAIRRSGGGGHGHRRRHHGGGRRLVVTVRCRGTSLLMTAR